MKYLLVKNGALSYSIYDKEKCKIITLENGQFKDNTEECEKLYKSKTKSDRMGSLYYRYILGEIDRKQCMIYDNEVIIDTDDFLQVDKLLLDMQKRQIEFMLENVNATISKYENNRQYYTYCFR